MGKEDNFTVDPMNGRLILQIGRSKIISVPLEKVEEKKQDREEEESDADVISNMDFPEFDFQEETEENKFVRELEHFQGEMERKKKEWEETMPKKIDWKWNASWAGGGEYAGQYEGQLNHNSPHGLGRWNSDDGKFMVEGDGQLDGKAVVDWGRYRDEYETRDGLYNGK